MAWRKSNFLILLVFIVIQFLLNMNLLAQETEKWSKESWEKAKSGIDYGQKEEKVEDNQIQQEIDLDFDIWKKSGIGKAILIVLLIALFIFILVKVLNSNNDAKLKSETDDVFNLQYVEENLEDVDINKFLENAIDGGDFRVATRLLYLQTLKLLHESEFIHWRKDKTNNDFLSEMRPHPSYKIFRELTLAYEVVWYGDHIISTAEFERVSEGFKKFGKLIQPKAS